MRRRPAYSKYVEYRIQEDQAHNGSLEPVHTCLCDVIDKVNQKGNRHRSYAELPALRPTLQPVHLSRCPCLQLPAQTIQTQKGRSQGGQAPEISPFYPARSQLAASSCGKKRKRFSLLVKERAHRQLSTRICSAALACLMYEGFPAVGHSQQHATDEAVPTRLFLGALRDLLSVFLRGTSCLLAAATTSSHSQRIYLECMIRPFFDEL
mmetsp:Transcript_39442/g.101121  ORF Transcript_39442/g.101121 Transcript_39442/m.101121 type:complete len:208 (+) Transcript_39442:1221-1844(+)